MFLKLIDKVNEQRANEITLIQSTTMAHALTMNALISLFHQKCQLK